MPEAIRIPIRLTADPSASGPRPVRIGIPLPRAALADIGRLALRDPSGLEVPCDAQSLSRWPDGSLKWILLRFLATGDSNGTGYALSLDGPVGPADPTTGPLRWSDAGAAFHIETGAARFTVPKDGLHPWGQVEIGSEALLEAPAAAAPSPLRGMRDEPLRFKHLRGRVEFSGKVALDLAIEGTIVDAAGKEFCRAASRITFYAGTALSLARITLWNPRAARHAGGLWDLGDPGSVLFKSLSLPIRFAPTPGMAGGLSLDPDSDGVIACDGTADLFQGSSGGANWRSRNHVDSRNEVPLDLAGYRLTNGASAETGARANPAALIRHRAGTAAFSREHFWQAFPSRIAVTDASVTLEPFPDLGGKPHELQGGEKAVFSLWADFLTDPERPRAALSAARRPVAAIPDPEWIAASGCVGGVTTPSAEEDPFFAGLESGWISGPHSVFALREEYDEYGWRNFGEVPADHEKQHYKGRWEFVSHYNNQYDLVLSFLRESLRTGDPRWRALGDDLARHVVDHDLYHTQADKPAYNGGYFWHTAHYAHAGTATHRTFSRHCMEGGPLPAGFGGGPSNEHNYTSGLLLHHWLTGDPDSREAVLMLARWVRDMQDGSRTPLRFLSRNPTGLSTCTRHLDFQGPGRGAGYSVNACLDAYALTSDPDWMRLAEDFIRTCIHPGDDCSAMGLLDRENRWSYVIFLQILAKYLDVKLGLGQMDAAFRYARASLLHYADWMAEKESPNLSDPSQLEYPTSTWAAQDLRKSDALFSAGRFAEPGKDRRYFEKADFFRAQAKRYLEGFEDRGSVRNMAILLYSLPACREREAGGLRSLDLGPVAGPFPARVSLVPQKIQFLRNAKAIAKTGGLAAAFLFFRHIRNRCR
ncbi:MAG: hypothetical protein JWP91_1622 [Fibrobacteres bacterium]|nr:hypothetical protein [Fibrobacterota bacterium]